MKYWIPDEKTGNPIECSTDSNSVIFASSHKEYHEDEFCRK